MPPGMEVAEGERVTVRISSRRPVRAKLTDEPAGLAVERTDLSEALGRSDAGVRIATSRFGERVSINRLSGLSERIERDGMTVAFGAPGRGLPAILDMEVETADALADAVEPGSSRSTGFDLWLNTIPRQGSETVRTEEAMFASLACLTLTE